MRCTFRVPPLPGKVGETELHTFPVYRHVGLYAYRREQLLAFTRWNSTPYELAEGLEQLRFLEHGVPIHVVETNTPLIGVDVPSDLEAGETNFGGLHKEIFMTKYIFVTGGVISGIGKGITTASLGRLLINRGV